MNIKEGIGLIKGRLIISVVLFFLACSIGSAFAADDNKFVPYQNETYKFKLEYPEGWKIIEGYRQVAVAFAPMSERGFHPNVNIVVQDMSNYPGLTLQKFGENGLLQLGELVTDFKLISIEKSSLYGKPALICIFDGKQGIYNLRWMQVYTLNNNRAYVITFTSGNTEFNTYQEAVERMINSFTIN